MKKCIPLLLTTLSFVGLYGDDYCEQEVEYCEPMDECYEEGVECDLGYYVGGFGGINFSRPKDTIGFVGGLSVGYKFEKNFRVEGEFAYRISNRNSHKTEIYSLMANAYHDFDLGKSWTPYFGLGVGYGRLNEREKYSDWWGYRHVKKNNVVYQGIVGVDRKIFESTYAGLEYRCIFFKENLKGNSVLISLKRYL